MDLLIILAWIGCTLLAMGWYPCCCSGSDCACGEPAAQMSVYFPSALLTDNTCSTCDDLVGTYYCDYVGSDAGVCTWEYFAEDEPCTDLYTRITVTLDGAGLYTVLAVVGYTADLPIGGMLRFNFVYNYGACWDVATGAYNTSYSFVDQTGSPGGNECFSMTDFGGTPFAYLQEA